MLIPEKPGTGFVQNRLEFQAGGTAKKKTSSFWMDLNSPRERILPLCLQVEPHGFEGVCLLLYGVPHHAPEAVRHAHRQVSGRHLSRRDQALPGRKYYMEHFFNFELIIPLLMSISSFTFPLL